MEPSPYRQACDRCHFQKLRCRREPDCSGGACIRCFKAGVQCVTSPSLRVRRAQSRRPQSVSSSNGWESRRSSTPANQVQSANYPRSPPCANTLANSLANSPVPEHGTFKFHSNNHPTSTPSDTTAPEPFIFDPSLSDFCWPSETEIGFTNFGHKDTTIPFTTAEDDRTFTDLTEAAQLDVSNTEPLSSILYPQPMETTEDQDEHLQEAASFHCLSQANLELFQHLAVVRRARDSCMAQAWPIDKTFSVSYRLLQALENLPLNIQSQHDSSTVLLIFSCYTRIVEIHGALYEHLGSLGPNPPDQSGSSTRVALPSLSMGGFEISGQSSFYIPSLSSLADSLLTRIRTVVLKIGSRMKSPEGSPIALGVPSTTDDSEDATSDGSNPQWSIDDIWRTLAEDERLCLQRKREALKVIAP
ncbi:hypothetical protein GGS21DRAFT_496423 [Xylaria nigripes]|nr:hypothetical protein GGS21DRAFT_496423 [Xylaria nigripes]